MNRILIILIGFCLHLQAASYIKSTQKFIQKVVHNPSYSTYNKKERGRANITFMGECRGVIKQRVDIDSKNMHWLRIIPFNLGQDKMNSSDSYITLKSINGFSKTLKEVTKRDNGRTSKQFHNTFLISVIPHDMYKEKLKIAIFRLTKRCLKKYGRPF